jgi:hypothetical protein
MREAGLQLSCRRPARAWPETARRWHPGNAGLTWSTNPAEVLRHSGRFHYRCPVFRPGIRHAGPSAQAADDLGHGISQGRERGEEHGVADCAESAVGERHAGAAQPAWLRNLGRQVLVLGEDLIANARLHMRHSAFIRYSAAPRPPRAFRGCTTFPLMSSASWLFSRGHRSYGPRHHASTTGSQFVRTKWQGTHLVGQGSHDGMIVGGLELLPSRDLGPT